MVEFYLLTFPRFPLRKKEHKSYFGKNRTHDFRTSRCAAYLLDHSGDELQETTKCFALREAEYFWRDNSVWGVKKNVFCARRQQKTKFGSDGFIPVLRKNLNASRPSEYPSVRGGEMSKRLGRIIVG